LSNTTYIALGSNLGDSVVQIQNAFCELQIFSRSSLACSSLWRSEPIGCPPDSPDFINAVVEIEPLEGETPESLLTKLQALEVKFGRKPKERLNEPRSLDLDIIAFGDEARETPQLTLPHPRWHQRRFVLEPLSEIAPDAILPGQSQPVIQLLAKLDTREVLVRL
jgi:2-amino-4-hydroxy-6-hydroxymethyldihydropteridine diphosphokinase